MRTGDEYIKTLNDGRTVLIDGEAVENVAEHPAFRNVIGTIAELFDIAAEPANGMQYHSEEIDGPANRVFSIPRTPEELKLRRQAVERWAKHTHGWVGRSPDHVGTFFAAFGAHPEVFEDTEHDYAGNITRYYKRILAENLYVSYAIIPPQVSRATTASGWEGDFLQVGVVKETDEGLIVRGSQMLATGGAIADEVFVTCIKPLGPDDVDFAISFALPAATEGLKFLCRRPFAPAATSEFDYPLTSHYDEPDALVVFEDVLVPWDRVFINRNIDTLRRQFFETGAHALGNWQAQTRFTTKLQFIAAVARKVTQVNGTDKIPGVQEKLGELAAVVSSVESALIAAEYTAEADSSGMLVPGKRSLYGAMGLQSETYPRVIAILRDLVGGGVLQLPSGVVDMKSPVTAPDIERYIASPGVPSEERIKLFRLAWDIIGSEFAGRHQQYELFYAGAPFVVKGVYTYRNYGYEAQVAELNEFLAGYGVDGRKEEN
ncbi:4-hydroxyphenylacetate 3-hydroxylase [Paenarthrobacter ureafaciens]|uniref:4-hydroxyphenylacetate 3-hydroxylase family protein n=1 Tax=Micrococcaceae TaxID=1268 RepID=UPI0012F86AB6|nr:MULTISPECIES: 4-hydroxyphenylacetate 3-hydroxylase N-terminal domain-containing protein [Micrococcaceae]MUU69811.1 4-hydroxyphenylacetate 3-hydroxylase [Pseudarthrobacter sp. GA104]NWL29265.1 4-hydroxyphenylacetate 3-hydroxylase [Paenarthrobacter ureafaciens]QSZ53999.1 4-hydroxyphenylacetate 3-hydroxylase [Paenarthrobacter ureafaciens]WOC62784.1 4-hydroxyphenylacetate 3-hydroxylase N-terminal domain-containing protein [Paenarthrobacter sp. AT5]